MNKDIYRAAMDNIRPDDALMERIETQMITKRKAMPTLRAKKARRTRTWALAACCVLVLGVTALLFARLTNPLGTQQPNSGASASVSASSESESATEPTPVPEAMAISVEPTATTDGMVALGASFRVVCEEEADADTLAAAFAFEPETTFTLEADGDGFLLTPEALEPESIVRLTYREAETGANRAWAFQIAPVFRAVSTLPAEGSTSAFINTGIEVTFSLSDVAVSEFERCLSIEPSVSGSVRKRGTTLVFVPDDYLAAMTDYTVTVDGSLANAEGETLGEALSFTFRTANYTSDYNYLAQYLSHASYVSESFSTKDAPIIAVYTSFSDVSQVPCRVELFRYADADAYASALTAYTRSCGENGCISYDADLSGLTPVATYESSLTTGREINWGPRYFVFDEPLEAGWYAARVTVDDPALTGGRALRLTKLLQITDLSVYYTAVGGETLFWTNDMTDGTPVAGATIDLAGESLAASVTTEADGTALASTGASEDGAARFGVLRVTDGDRVFVDAFSATEPDGLPVAARYATFLYSDRPIYMSTDTIRFWGVLRPYSGKAVYPKEMAVTLNAYDGDLYTVPVTLTEDGRFEGEMPIEDVVRVNDWSGFTLTLTGDGETIARRYLEIRDYEKPVYETALTLDRPVCAVGETLTGALETHFYDGTPASGVVYGFNFEDQYAAFVTDGDGRVELSIEALPVVEYTGSGTREATTWRPAWRTVSATPSGAEDVYFSAYKPYYVFGRDIALIGRYDEEAGTLAVTADTLDLTRATDLDTALYDDCALLRDAPYDTEVVCTLTRTWVERTETGSYYDPINRVNVKQYNYTDREETVWTRTVNTAGGKATLTGLPTPDEDSGYYVTLEANDRAGRRTTERVTLYYFAGYSDTAPVVDYTFVRAGSDPYGHTFTEDDATMTFTVQKNGEAVTEGRVLTLALQTGVSYYGVSGAAEAHIPYDETLLPNYWLLGVYYDGAKLHPVRFPLAWENPNGGIDIETPAYWYNELWLYQDRPYTVPEIGANMAFASETRALGLTVTPDKAAYAPGDTATVSVEVTNPHGSAANVRVLVSIVDEAIFAIAEDNSDVLAALYENAFDPVRRVFVSHRTYDKLQQGGGGGGGGGEGAIREEFKDTAFFREVTTGADGKAKATLTLPDNITTWRVTAHAVSGDLGAATARARLVSTQPFFLTASLCETLIAGDDLSVTLRGFGGGVDGDTFVAYTAKLTGGAEPLTAEGKGFAKAYTSLTLGKPPVGEYELTLTASAGGKSDAIRVPVVVVESAAEIRLTADRPLDALGIEPSRFPVTLTVYNADESLPQNILTLLSAAGDRLDQRVARVFAANTLTGGGEKADVADLLLADGTYKLLPYGERDLETTALAYLSAPDVFEARRFDLLALLGDTPSAMETAEAYLLASAVGQPLLAGTQALVGDPTGLAYKDLLYLIAALAKYGDTDRAQEAFDLYVAPYLAETTSDGGRTLVHLAPPAANNAPAWYQSLAQTGFDLDKRTLAAAALLSATLLGDESAEGLTAYLVEDAAATPHLFQLMFYLENTKTDTAPGVFTIDTGDGAQEVTLGRWCGETVVLSKPQFETLRLTVVSGDLRARVAYTGGADEAAEQPGNALTVTKTCSKDAPRVGDRVTVTLTVTLPDGETATSCRVNDYVPSSMRYLALPDSGDTRLYYLIDQTRQNVSLAGWSSNPVSVFTLRYDAICVSAGDSVAERAFAFIDETTAGSALWGMSGRGVITSTAAER